MSIFILTSRLGRDAELRTTSGDKKVLAFSLPDERGYGDKKQTLWIDCALWGERAEKLAQYLTKGTLVEVHGEISCRVYESKGEHKAQLQLNVRELKLHGGKPQGEKQGSQQSGPSMDDDIPF